MTSHSLRTTIEQLSPGSSANCPLSVSELASWINEVVREGVGYVWVEGEVRDLKTYPSGHTYCSLADEAATVNVAMFSRIELPEGIKNGTHLLVRGRPEFYGPGGRLSLVAEEVHISGEGELWAKIEKTREKLAADGLFDEERKRPLPLLPATVGVVCGFDAAVKRDILAAVDRRFPGYPLVFEEVPVQGDRAVTEIIQAMERLTADPRVEVIILARGGGSLAELAPFYDESLCRAIARCPVPVVSAIGHEKDNPLSDLVADARASTPSRAAIEVIPDEAELRDRLDRAVDIAYTTVRRRLETAEAKLASLNPTRTFKEAYLARKELVLAALESTMSSRIPEATIERQWARLQSLRVQELFLARIDRAQSSLNSLTASLEALSPRATLKRGFAVVRKVTGEIVRAPLEAPEGTVLSVTLAGGILGVVSRGEPRESADPGD